MEPDQIKKQLELIDGMDDETLKNMSKYSGMNMSPEMLRQSLNMMKSMDSETMKQMYQNLCHLMK